MGNESFDYSQYDPELVSLVEEYVKLMYFHLKGEPYTSNAKRSFVIIFSKDPIEVTREKVSQLKAMSETERLNGHYNRELEWERMTKEAMRLEGIQFKLSIKRY